jgi:2-polyprenyl-6-methoxyphenol hydroxylase-like FAD-dependent oxidoreductase
MVNSLVADSATKVAIIGSGPAGATLGALLARQGASVAMFDDGARPPLIVGESLIPQMIPIFRRLGIEEKVAAIGVYKPGVLVTFSDEDELLLSFTAARGVLPTYAYNVPRKEFDDLLLETAVDSGVRYVECAAKLKV